MFNMRICYGDLFYRDIMKLTTESFNEDVGFGTYEDSEEEGADDEDDEDLGINTDHLAIYQQARCVLAYDVQVLELAKMIPVRCTTCQDAVPPTSHLKGTALKLIWVCTKFISHHNNKSRVLWGL